MRERSTWNRDEVVMKAAAAKKAAEKPGDIYTMNQDHPQPGFDAYVIGDPSDFAEDVHSPNTWDAEYSGDAVKRNEIGMPEMRGDTFNHSEKTAAKRETMIKKADLCVEVARLMLKGTKVASESAIEDQAVALMWMPDQELINTHARLAAEQDEHDEDEKEEQQSKQAGEVPPQFLEHMKKKEDGDDKDEDKKDQGEKKQAQQDQGDKDEEKSEQAQGKQAQDQDGDGQDEDAKAEKDWPADKKAAQNMMAQMQQMHAQLQQMMQSMQGQPQQAPMAQEQDLDQMLAADSCGPMAEVDIQMDPFMDDMNGDMQEDEVLKSLFASEEDEEMQQVQQEQEQAAQDQQKQAKLSRTASTRTVGTRPSAGVAKLGGSSKTASATSVDNLSSLWQTAPDVRGAFGLK